MSSGGARPEAGPKGTIEQIGLSDGSKVLPTSSSSTSALSTSVILDLCRGVESLPIQECVIGTIDARQFHRLLRARSRYDVAARVFHVLG